jgi:hypothetical protein
MNALRPQVGVHSIKLVVSFVSVSHTSQFYLRLRLTFACARRSVVLNGRLPVGRRINE